MQDQPITGQTKAPAGEQNKFLAEKDKMMQARIAKRRQQAMESAQAIYNMHKSNFIPGKVQARVLSDNRRFLNLSANMPQSAETYRFITDKILQPDRERKARLRKSLF